MAGARIDWIDYAKGLCIILLVVMQSATGYAGLAGSAGWMQGLAHWASPFTLPALFLISGFFLNRTLFGSKSIFFDRKILRFAYFYAIWLVIHTAFFQADLLFSQPLDVAAAFGRAWVDPVASLWVIPMLAIFHMLTWLMRFVPIVRILGAAAALQILHSAGFVTTGWTVLDRFAELYVFFFAGYAGMAVIQRYAKALSEGFSDVPAALLVWAAINTALVTQGTAGLPVVSLILGFAGAFAVLGLATQLSRKNVLGAIRYAGQRYLVIYLTSFLPMVAMQILLVRSGFTLEAGLATLAVTLVAILTPLALHRAIRLTPMMALYRRPPAFRLKTVRQQYAGGLIATSPEKSPEGA